MAKFLNDICRKSEALYGLAVALAKRWYSLRTAVWATLGNKEVILKWLEVEDEVQKSPVNLQGESARVPQKRRQRLQGTIMF